jgi:hypothetical protein
MPLFGASFIRDPKSPGLPEVVKSPPILVPSASRSENWSPTGGTTAPPAGSLTPRTDPASLPGMVTPYRGHEIVPGPGGGYMIIGGVPGMAMMARIPLTSFPAGTSMENMQAWVDRRIEALAAKTAAPASTSPNTAKQAALPTTDGKGLPTADKGLPTTPTPATGPDLAVVKPPMSKGAKVAIGAGAGLLALLAFKG